MYLLTSLPSCGDKIYNSCLFTLYRCSRTPIVLPLHKNNMGMDTALLIWNIVISHTSQLKSISSDGDPKFTSKCWTNLLKILGTKLSFSTVSHPKTDELEERIICTIEEIISRFCSYFLELKDYYGFTCYWCTLITELELSYNSSIHASTGKG
ncbi:hypothetical protein O181_085443 [Austropuccinia psidii MF-1]|uniref:Integrase catalytic domain-containing protein n=1 Tax=Austropuccinia psidii MF-1 TaxID=1389203 RepID=A0A9Q3FXI4_9BASI|nr:hypothetical protein [Austropuccinia psidii MF-1]